MTFSLVLVIIFFALGSIHIYWSCGGLFGLSTTLPTKEDGTKVLNPKKRDSLIVGIGLLFFCFFYLAKSSIIDFHEPKWIFTYGQWIIPSIFFLRAIGDFKYVGLFKQIRKTAFGKADTLFFSPLCLVISILGFLIALA